MSFAQQQTPAQFSSEPVNFQFTPDEGPGRYRIGLLALSNDLATERDFLNMRPCDDVAIFVSRIPNTDVCSVETLRAMEPELTRCTSLLIPGSRLDSIAYSCTSGTVVMGYETVLRRVQEVRPEIPVATPITAALDALKRFNAKKVAILTPYTDDVNSDIFSYVAASGLEVVAFTSFHCVHNNDMAQIPPQAIFDAAVQADRTDADALFISCTAIRAVEVIEAIEQKIGKPVVSANQALFWQALRSAGHHQPIRGFGRLLHLPECAAGG